MATVKGQNLFKWWSKSAFKTKKVNLILDNLLAKSQVTSKSSHRLKKQQQHENCSSTALRKSNGTPNCNLFMEIALCSYTETHSVAKSTIQKNIWSEINIQWKQRIFTFETGHYYAGKTMLNFDQVTRDRGHGVPAKAICKGLAAQQHTESSKETKSLCSTTKLLW